MKNLIHIVITSSIIIFFISGKSFGQIKGNGDVFTKESSLDFFSSIENGLSADIDVEIGDKPSISITVDKNLVKYIDIQIVEGVLSIDQAKWISSTQKIKILITASQLISFSNSAHGKHTISGIDAKSFTLVSNVGDIKISGQADQVTIVTGTGTMNALGLETKKAFVKVTSFGTIAIDADEVIDADVSDNGKIIYADEPDLLKQKTKEGGQVISLEENNAPAKEVAYVNINIKNNSDRRIQVEFKGPEFARFGYGAPFNSFQSRKERFPVGTKIYLKRPMFADKLLVEIKESDGGSTVELFK